MLIYYYFSGVCFYLYYWVKEMLFCLVVISFTVNTSLNWNAVELGGGNSEETLLQHPYFHCMKLWLLRVVPRDLPYCIGFFSIIHLHLLQSLMMSCTRSVTSSVVCLNTCNSRKSFKIRPSLQLKCNLLKTLYFSLFT